MNKLKLSTLIAKEALQKRIKELGAELTEKFRDQDVVMVCILKGAFTFYADLIRNMETDIHCDFFGVSSYSGMNSTGEVKLTLDLSQPIAGRHVVLVEDIIDTGLTMNFLLETLAARKPKSFTTVALLHKPDALKVKTQIDFVGFKIPNDFVVGYGLDYQGYYRNLPYIARVENLN